MRDWIHRHPLLTNLLLIVLIVGPGYWRIEGVIDEQKAIIDQACADRVDSVSILRELVKLSDDSRGGGGRVPLTALPSFAEVKQENPDVAAWIEDLEAALTPPPPEGEAEGEPPPASVFVRRALALLDVPDC